MIVFYHFNNIMVKKVLLNNNFLEIPIAHRGLHNDNVCENSMQAFINAKNAKIAIELDIYWLKDGKFAVFHDKNLNRMTGHNLKISSLTSNELKNFNLYDGQKIPFLDEVLKEIDGEVPILIELKPENKSFKNKGIKKLLELLKEYNHNDKIAIQSFNPFTVKNMKKHTKVFPVGLLSSFNLGKIPKFENYILSSLMLFKFIKADFISYDVNFLPNKFVTKFKSKGTQVLTWVVDSEEKLNNAIHFSDNIIFENLNITDELFIE